MQITRKYLIVSTMQITGPMEAHRRDCAEQEQLTIVSTVYITCLIYYRNFGNNHKAYT